MSNKQIIIDGVDVKLFRTPSEVIDYLQQDAVRVVTIELFEQLKRKEQKLEKIQEILDIYYDDDWKATREIQKIIKE